MRVFLTFKKYHQVFALKCCFHFVYKLFASVVLVVIVMSDNGYRYGQLAPCPMCPGQSYCVMWSSTASPTLMAREAAGRFSRSTRTWSSHTPRGSSEWGWLIACANRLPCNHDTTRLMLFVTSAVYSQWIMWPMYMYHVTNVPCDFVEPCNQCSNSGYALWLMYHVTSRPCNQCSNNGYTLWPMYHVTSGTM